MSLVSEKPIGEERRWLNRVLDESCFACSAPVSPQRGRSNMEPEYLLAILLCVPIRILGNPSPDPHLPFFHFLATIRADHEFEQGRTNWITVVWTYWTYCNCSTERTLGK